MKGRQHENDAVARMRFREVFTGANLREVMGHRDCGEIRVARASHPDGGDHLDATVEDDADALHNVWSHAVDGMSEHASLGPVLAPGGILFNAPEADEPVLTMRPADAAGISYVVLGVGGASARLPSWHKDNTAAGLYTPRVLRLQSYAQDVVVEAAPEHHVLLGDDTATKGVARVDDPVNLTNAWTTWLQGLATACGYLAPMPPDALAAISGGSGTVKAKD